MDIGFIYRTIRVSMILACIAFACVWFYYEFRFGAGILVGCAWGCLNLFAILLAVKALITPERFQKGIILVILFLKFPFIYFIGYVVLRLNCFPIFALLIGFSLILLVMTLKALGQMLASADSKKGLKSITQ